MRVPSGGDPSLIKVRSKLIPIKNRDHTTAAAACFDAPRLQGLSLSQGVTFLVLPPQKEDKKPVGKRTEAPVAWAAKQTDGGGGGKAGRGKGIQNILHRLGVSFVAYAK